MGPDRVQPFQRAPREAFFAVIYFVPAMDMDDAEIKPASPGDAAQEQAVAGAVADVDAPPPQELREDQIENAVSFLAHPKVRKQNMFSFAFSFAFNHGLHCCQVN